MPAGRIGRAEGGELVLDATREELAGMEPFEETHFIRSIVDRHVPGSAYTWPYVMHAKEPLYVVEKEERIPAGEVAVHRGAKVIATDGSVGKVDEFLVANEGRHVTHLVMREGHLWGKRDVATPVSQVQRMSEETVYLKLSRKGVEGLPVIPVRRKRGGPQAAEKQDPPMRR